jgi:hypothetical protein
MFSSLGEDGWLVSLGRGTAVAEVRTTQLLFLAVLLDEEGVVLEFFFFGNRDLFSAHLVTN